MEYLKIDDPVSCVPVHLLCGIFGLVNVGLFCEKDKFLSNTSGIFKGGPFSFFGYQCVASLAITGWSAVTAAIQVITN